MEAKKMKESQSRSCRNNWLGAIVEERRERAGRTFRFQEQDHALNELSQQPDDLIYGAWNMEDGTRPTAVRFLYITQVVNLAENSKAYLFLIDYPRPDASRSRARRSR